MEDWQLEAHQYAAGMYSEGVEDLLIKLEELIDTGEISVDEAIQIHSDLTNIKEKRMKSTNLLTKLLSENKTEQELKLLYKATINSFTSAVATNILIGLAQKRRAVQDELNASIMLSDMPEEGAHEAGAIPSHHGEPTLDQRNKEDAILDGDAFSKALTDAAGHEVPERPFIVAEICDGIRNDLYDEMFAFTNIADKKALYRHPPQQDPPNYDQPMGLDFNLQFRIKSSGTIDEARAQQVAKEDNQDVEFIRDIMRKDNARVAANLRMLMPEVIKTAESFNSNYTVDDFVNLPFDQQLRIAEKILRTIDNEYKRLYGIKIRTGSLDVANQCKIIQANWVEVKDWINETTKLMNLQSQNVR